MNSTTTKYCEATITVVGDHGMEVVRCARIEHSRRADERSRIRHEGRMQNEKGRACGSYVAWEGEAATSWRSVGFGAVLHGLVDALIEATADECPFTESEADRIDAFLEFCGFDASVKEGA